MKATSTKPSRLWKRMGIVEWEWVQAAVVNSATALFVCSYDKNNRGLIWSRDRTIKAWIKPSGSWFESTITSTAQPGLEITSEGPLEIVTLEVLRVMAEQHFKQTIADRPTLAAWRKKHSHRQPRQVG